jgi:hypothetical protein
MYTFVSVGGKKMHRAFTDDSNLVLRTVYLPLDLDELLRQLAFEKRVSKNELIRSLLQEALALNRKSTTKVAHTTAAAG